MNIDRPLLSIGTKFLDRYEVVAPVEQGGMQQVYLAHDHALNRNVALKTPISASARIRFEQSARLSAGISHPNVAKTFDYANDQGFEFLIEEFVEGENLQKRLDREHAILDPYLAAHIAHHIAKAVNALSANNVIHRDLKPSNIMVSGDPGMKIVKVTDFGVAKLVEEELNSIDPSNPSSITASKTMVGALPYMAPELIRKNLAIDKSKADVWAVGALLYKFLFGLYPFPIDDYVDCIIAITRGDYRDQSTFVSSANAQFRGLLGDLWEIIKKCLIVDVNARIDSSQLSAFLEDTCYNSDDREFGNITYVYDGPAKIGSITSVDGEQYFVHFDSCYPPKIAKRGDRVLFSQYPGDPNDRAFPVLICR